MGRLSWIICIGPCKMEAEGDLTQIEEGKADGRGGSVTAKAEVAVM